MGYRVDKSQLYHFICEHPQGPSLLTFRRLATIQGDQMGFFISGHFSTVSIGHRFAIQRSFKTFFDKTFLELLNFFGLFAIIEASV